VRRRAPHLRKNKNYKERKEALSCKPERRE